VSSVFRASYDISLFLAQLANGCLQISGANLFLASRADKIYLLRWRAPITNRSVVCTLEYGAPD